MEYQHVLVISCMQRINNTAVYSHNNKKVICELVRSQVPWDNLTQQRIKVCVTDLNNNGQRTSRSITYLTSSFSAAAAMALLGEGCGAWRVEHYC